MAVTLCNWGLQSQNFANLFLRCLQEAVQKVDPCQRSVHIVAKNTASSHEFTDHADMGKKTLIWQLPSKVHSQRKKVSFLAEGNDSFISSRWMIMRIIRNDDDQHSVCSEKFSSVSMFILTYQVMQTYWSMGRAHQHWPSWFEEYN